MIGQIKDKRGYTHDQLLWDTSWLNLLMEAADQPRYIKGAPRKVVPVAETAEDIKLKLG